jgi:hypothetical protein
MDEFTRIYKNKLWGYENGETLSGGGSTKEVNRYRNIFLADFINNNNIINVFDVCGDCNWQSDFIELVVNDEFEYFGFDVCEYALTIAKDKNKSNTRMRFSCDPINLCDTVLDCKNGENSLIIIKEVIQHLPLKHGVQMLKNIKKSGIKYIAITNHDTKIFNVNKNINVNIGEFYPNNMFLYPFNFVNPLKNIDDIIVNENEKRYYGNLIIFNIQEQNI